MGLIHCNFSQCECKTAPWTVPTVCGLLKGQTSEIFSSASLKTVHLKSLSLLTAVSLSSAHTSKPQQHLNIYRSSFDAWWLRSKLVNEANSEASAKFGVYCMAPCYSPQCFPSLSPKKTLRRLSMRDPTLQGLRLPPQPQIQQSLPFSTRFSTSGLFISVPDHRFVQLLTSILI